MSALLNGRWMRRDTFPCLRISTLANMGAYLSTFAPGIPTYRYMATLLAVVYKTPVIYCEVKAVFTTPAAVDAYRGAGPSLSPTYLRSVWSNVISTTPVSIR